MAAHEIHVGDLGTVFVLTVKDGVNLVDLSSATTKQILFEKPSGVLLTKTAQFVTDGRDGQLSYTTLAGDLNEPTGNKPARWKMQAYVVTPAGAWHSDIVSFLVYPNLS